MVTSGMAQLFLRHAILLSGSKCLTYGASIAMIEQHYSHLKPRPKMDMLTEARDDFKDE